MKVSYRGHEITVTREDALGGWGSVYYSVFRESDGFECLSGFSMEDGDTLESWIGFMKERIDAELADQNPWGGCDDE